MANNNPKYLVLSDTIKSLILNGTFRKGECLPSIRRAASLYGVSINTVIHAYFELECEGWIMSQYKSGYRVTDNLPQPAISMPQNKVLSKSIMMHELVEKVYLNKYNKQITNFADGALDSKYYPIPQLNKHLVDASRDTKLMNYESTQGNERLRCIISKNAFSWSGRLMKDDLITTTGSTNAVALALSALTRPGDTVAVESPCYFVFLQLAESLGLKVLEIPSDHEEGINLSTLEAVIGKIKACILVSNFNNPIGYCMTDDKKGKIVELLDYQNIPLIEDDLYGDIYFGNSRPRPFKAWDKSGNVIWCSSVSASIAPGYRVGWMAPGKYMDIILMRKKIMSLSLPSSIQEAIALYMEKVCNERHLLNLRKSLHHNCKKFRDIIIEHFPCGTKIATPKGGFMMWVELPDEIDTIDLYNRAIEEKISFAPGRMFTLQEKYLNCLRLSYGKTLTPNIENKLIRLGEIAKSMAR